MIRNLRHRPPGRAGNEERRRTFDAALEQAEQLFTAAENVGPSARPLLLFYGISQSGRAISAAASNVQDDDYKLGGHGITALGMDAVTESGLSTLRVKDKGKGAYTRLAEILNCASFSRETELGAFWGLLPELRRFPLPNMQDARTLNIKPTSSSVIRSGSVALARIQSIPDHLAYNPTEETALTDPVELTAERRRVTEFLNKYPTLSGFEIHAAPDRPTWVDKQNGNMTVNVELPDRTGTRSEHEEISSRTTCYRGQQCAFPMLGGSLKPAHPFLMWWALTFALSMLARYAPNEWIDRISVSTSADATAIEHALNSAIAFLPELIHRTVFEVV